VAKNVSSSDDANADLTNTAVMGDLTVDGSALGSNICGSEVGGDASLTGSQAGTGSAIMVGGAACDFDVFGGDLTVNGNANPVSITGDVVLGALSCSGNAAAPTGGARVRGLVSGQCAGLGTTASGLPTDRESSLWGWVSSRSAAAGTAATAAGLATITDGTTDCSGTATGLSINANLTVEAGMSCVITNSSVSGKVAVKAGGNLLLSNSTVSGAVSVQSNGFVSATAGSKLMGNVTLANGFGLDVESSTVSGNVAVNGSGFLNGVSSSFKAISSSNGDTYLGSSQVSGNLSANGDVMTDVNDSTVWGSTYISSPTNGSVVCGSEFVGMVTVNGAKGGAVQLGASGPAAGCTVDVFEGGLTLSNNAAPVTLGGNVIEGNLSCGGNATAPAGTSTRVRGTVSGQCS
jgi:hypothetical protein